MRKFIALLVFTVIGVGKVKADSDGYFCSSPGFLAYEFSFSKEPADQHKLYVIRFDTEAMSGQQWLQIPEFQVHGMRCSIDRVEIIGWEKHYSYSVSANGVTPLAEEELPIPGKLPEDFMSDTANLGAFGPVTRGAMPGTYTYTLTADRPDGNYEIRLQRQQTDNPCRSIVESNLVRTGRFNQVTVVRNLFTGIVPVECGE